MRDEKGVATLEMAVVLPLLMVIVMFIVAWGWWWYSQLVAGLALHDGGRDAAVRLGSVPAGIRTTRELMGSFLGGPNMAAYEGSWAIWESPMTRSVQGRLVRYHERNIPYLGRHVFAVEAGTFQRRWLFYPGPPQWWE